MRLSGFGARSSAPNSPKDFAESTRAMVTLYYLDEVFVRIQGKQHYLWRAVDQDGEVVDVFLQSRSYGVAHRELIPDVVHGTAQYVNNRAELSHQPTRVRERGMRRFKSACQAQSFLSTHSAIYNLFNLDRHLISANHYQFFRARSLPLGYNGHLRLGKKHRLCRLTISGD